MRCGIIPSTPATRLDRSHPLDTPTSIDSGGAMSPRTRIVLGIGIAAATAIGGAGPSGNRPLRAPTITHGVARGDVTPTSAVIWARASGRAQMHVEIDTQPTFETAKSRGSDEAIDATDFTA